MKQLLLIIMLLFVLKEAKSDPWYYHNWYFGGNSMISFISTSGKPEKKFYSAMIASEGSTSVSDAEGNVLFYCNGEVIYNRNNEIMENGMDIKGNTSAPQSSFAVPVPGNDGLFYLFTMAANEDKFDGLQYHIIDVIDNLGDGKVIEKNQMLKSNLTEAMTITLLNGGQDYCEGIGYWVIVTSAPENRFYSFRVDSNKIHNPVFSTMNGVINPTQIAISHDFQKAALTYDDQVALYDFNSVTGKLTFTGTRYDIDHAYGVEFSPNNELIYVSSLMEGEIHQIDLLTSQTHIFTPENVTKIGSLQIGPDGRIYASLDGKKYLAAFLSPNNKGLAADFDQYYISLDPSACRYGLPQTLSNIPECSTKVIRQIYLVADEVCEGETVLLYARKYPDGQYTWTTPNGEQYTGSFISLPAKMEYNGEFQLHVEFPNGQIIDLSTNVKVTPGPKFTITGDTTLCGIDDKVKIRADADQKLDTLYWNVESTAIDSSSSLIYPTEPGKYVVYGRTKLGCVDSLEVNVVRFDPVEAEIEGDNIICSHDESTLTAMPLGDPGEYEYEWSTGATSESIAAADSGDYWVRVYQVGGCYDTAWFNLQYYEPYIPEYNIESPVTICQGEVLQITLMNEMQGYYYEWENGSQSTNRKVSEAGEYILMSRTTNDCISYDTVHVFVKNPPEAKILEGDNLVSCAGAPVQLTAKEVETDYYEWSTGETSKEITVDKSGNYWLAVGFLNSPCIDTAFINVNFDADLKVEISGNKKLCGDESTVLSTNYTGSVFLYEWSTGETTPEITVSEAGEYTVRVSTSSGCEDTGEFEVQVFEQPSAELNYTEDQSICEGETLVLIPQNVNSAYNNYWEDGFQELEREITQSGTYTYISENDICTDTARITVTVNPIPEISIETDGTSLCVDPEIELTAVPFNSENTYEWSTGEDTESIVIDTPGTYQVTVTSPAGCMNTTEILIDEAGDIDFTILPGSEINLCEGESVTLTVSHDYQRYEWSTGESTKSITVTEAGEYSVTVYDESGCSATKSAEVKVNYVELAIDKNRIDFEEICIDGLSSDIITVTNLNTNDITIDSYVLELEADEDNMLKRTYNPQITLLASESDELIVDFSSPFPADWTGTLTINVTEPCEAVYELDVSARTIHRTSLDLPEIRVDAGEQGVEIALAIENECEIASDFTSDYRAVIRYDAYYYEAASTLAGVVPGRSFEDRDILLEISGNYSFTETASNNIFTLTGQALIGREEEAPITLEEFEWMNPNIYYEKEPGSIVINEFCQQNFSEIEFFTETDLKITPNPAVESIEAYVQTEEKGNFKLMLVNSLGEPVKTILFSNNSQIDETISIDLSDVNAGVYNLVLKAPWSMISERVVIVK